MGQSMLVGVHKLEAMLLALGLVGCGMFGEGEPALPAPRPVAVAADWPAEAVTAFRPADGRKCPARYRFQHGICIHVAMRGRVADDELLRQVEAYRAGAASPRVGGGPAPVELAQPVIVDPLDPSTLPPDALTIQRPDAVEARRERLRQLDDMIRAARIRAGERPDSNAPEATQGNLVLSRTARSRAAVEPVRPPSAPVSVAGDTKTLSEMTAGLPPEVLRSLLADIERNGGAQIVPAEELEALQRRVGEDEPDKLAGTPD